MPAQAPSNGTYVTRGEFAEFREEVRGSLAEVTRSLRGIPTKEDIARTISSEVGASKQVSPAMIAALVSVALAFAGLYARDQSNTEKRIDEYKIMTEQRIARTETRIYEVVAELDIKLQREAELMNHALVDTDTRLQREMDLKDEVGRLKTMLPRQ